MFTTRINVPPGKEKELRDQVSSLVIPAGQRKASSSDNRETLKERVVILRLEYADGSAWHSAARN